MSPGGTQKKYFAKKMHTAPPLAHARTLQRIFGKANKNKFIIRSLKVTQIVQQSNAVHRRMKSTVLCGVIETLRKHFTFFCTRFPQKEATCRYIICPNHTTYYVLALRP